MNNFWKSFFFSNLVLGNELNGTLMLLNIYFNKCGLVFKHLMLFKHFRNLILIKKSDLGKRNYE